MPLFIPSIVDWDMTPLCYSCFINASTRAILLPYILLSSLAAFSVLLPSLPPSQPLSWRISTPLPRYHMVVFLASPRQTAVSQRFLTTQTCTFIVQCTYIMSIYLHTYIFYRCNVHLLLLLNWFTGNWAMAFLNYTEFRQKQQTSIIWWRKIV